MVINCYCSYEIGFECFFEHLTHNSTRYTVLGDGSINMSHCYIHIHMVPASHNQHIDNLLFLSIGSINRIVD
jgi:hypothetical protein